jgi:hypothetical protein
MISTALDGFTAPPSSRLLGWRLLDARSSDGWVRIGFDGKPEFCNPAGFIQGGILSAMLDDTMGPAVFVMSEGRLYTATITMTVNFLAPRGIRWPMKKPRLGNHSRAGLSQDGGHAPFLSLCRHISRCSRCVVTKVSQT